MGSRRPVIFYCSPTELSVSPEILSLTTVTSPNNSRRSPDRNPSHRSKELFTGGIIHVVGLKDVIGVRDVGSCVRTEGEMGGSNCIMLVIKLGRGNRHNKIFSVVLTCAPDSQQ